MMEAYIHFDNPEDAIRFVRDIIAGAEQEKPREKTVSITLTELEAVRTIEALEYMCETLLKRSFAVEDMEKVIEKIDLALLDLAEGE